MHTRTRTHTGIASRVWHVRGMCTQVKHPLIEPKCLADRGKGGGGDRFMKKAADQDEKSKRKKKGADDDSAGALAKTGLSYELNKLELELRHRYATADEKAAPDKDTKRASKYGTNRASAIGRKSRG